MPFYMGLEGLRRLKPQRSIYVKPWLKEGKLIGWTWEIVSNGRVSDTGRTPQPTIALARDEAIARSQTMVYPGSYVEWDKFWNEGGGEVWQEGGVP